MAAPLRYPLILLAWGAMAAIYLPLLPAAGELVGAARSPAHWRALFADPQLGQALAATLVSTLLSVGGALLIALTIVAALWPSAAGGGWLPVCRCCWRYPILPWRRRRCCCSPKGVGSGSGCRF